jgi:prophage DNA circulation protein
LEESFGLAEDQANAFSGFFNFGEDDVTGDTPVREQERKNKRALNNFMRRVAAVKAANSAASGDYVSFDDALNKREEISAVLEAQLALDDGTEVFQSLADVKAQLVDALPDIDADLPNLKEITVEDDSNSLLLAYDLFERADNESDLIERNGIRNPAVIAAGTKLEVIDER